MPVLFYSFGYVYWLSFTLLYFSRLSGSAKATGCPGRNPPRHSQKIYLQGFSALHCNSFCPENPRTWKRQGTPWSLSCLNVYVFKSLQMAVYHGSLDLPEGLKKKNFKGKPGIPIPFMILKQLPAQLLSMSLTAEAELYHKAVMPSSRFRQRFHGSCLQRQSVPVRSKPISLWKQMKRILKVHKSPFSWQFPTTVPERRKC